YFLKDYKPWYFKDLSEDVSFYQKHVQLVNTGTGGDFNLVFVTKEGKLVNTSKLLFETSLYHPRYTIPTDDSLTVAFTYEVEPGKSIQKIFTFYGKDYESKVDVEFNNMSEIISGYTYDVEWGTGINFVERNSVDEATYSNASAYSGEEQVIIDASSEGETVTKDINGKVDWIGVRNKYFAIIIAPDNPSAEGGASFDGYNKNTQYGVREYYGISLKVPFNNTIDQKDQFGLYMGPLEFNRLESYGKNYDAIYDFGSFFGLKIITRPISQYVLLPLFTFLHTFIPNYGFVIVVFSIIIKFALYPLTKQSYKSMKKMQQLQPKIKEMKEKYKDDQQKVQKETMKLYSTYGINPAGGCMPMVLQMPILFALFTFFNVAVEIRNEPFIFWITNLSAPDILIELPFTLPLFGVQYITGLAPLLGITMFFQQKMSVRDPSQKALVYVMPIMFTLLFMGWSSGLNLYYFMFNLLSIIQQYYINHKKGEEELVPVKKSNQKKGFMSRMMEAAEKQAQAQKQGQKKRRR
ncbi:MAG: membrane protein insertase YidC, partial [Melioribacteraceae bacterium]|nr:membrane protein insertase YidC [Melioribacteraceae bacterium]